jgi:hypothetical protein
MNDPPLCRRRLIALLSSLPALAWAGKLSAAPPPESVTLAGTVPPFPEKPSLLVAGPEDGALNHWADALLPALKQSLPPDTTIRRVEVGSADGVTGANQFAVRGVPDGMTVLLVPGQAALAWMVGDPRAQFDVGHWVPVMAGMCSGIVVGRPAVLTSGSARVAATGPVSPALPAMLALELLGAKLEPAFRVTDPATAFANGSVDTVFLHGPRVRDEFSALSVRGALPLFTFGTIDESGRTVRDPTFPNVPHFAELHETLRRPKGPLFDAWSATAAAVQLEFSLVLLQLTPASIVALWRRAGADAAGFLPLQVASTAANVRLMSGLVATANTAAAAASATTLTELRSWLSSRFNWRPA